MYVEAYGVQFCTQLHTQNYRHDWSKSGWPSVATKKNYVDTKQTDIKASLNLKWKIAKNSEVKLDITSLVLPQ